MLLGDDGEDEVASGPEPTTATVTSAPLEGSGAPVIWPLPSMSITYPTPSDAAQAYYEQYLGLGGACGTDAATDAGRVDVPCTPPPPPCGTDSPSCGRAGATVVDVEQRGLDWVVLGSESDLFEVANPTAGAVVGANIEVDVTGIAPEATGVAELRPLGQPAGSAPQVDTATVPLSADGSWHLTLGAADGPVVLIVDDGASSTARVITVDSVAIPAETTTTTTGPTDDGVQGWPGATSRVFDDPSSAATAFVTDVLDFAQPDQRATAGSGTDVEITFAPRSTAGIETAITVHDTGTARGWVVTGTQSSEGNIDRAFLDGDVLVVRGVATAFEAQIAVVLLDLEGNVLAQTGALAGANGEQGPFEARFDAGAPVADAAFVLIGEGDASGEGRYTWATVEDLPALLANG
jgi:hypothetical protein